VTQRVCLLFDPDMSAPSTRLSSSDCNAHRLTSSRQGQGHRTNTSRLDTSASAARPTTARPQTGASVNAGCREAGYVVAVIEGRGEDSWLSEQSF
jgi:hypothetical protein